MWKAAVKSSYLQSLQWRLLKLRHPCSHSALSCFDHKNKIGGKCCYRRPSDPVIHKMKITTTVLTYDVTKTGRRLI